MNLVHNFFGHLKTVCTHKRWVFHYCRKAGITWQGITHDLSKFSPVEFFEGVKYFDGTRSPINVCKEQNNGVSKAWLHHKGRNKHHYEYWVDKVDEGGVALEMPDKYFKELLCDYLGAGRAYMGKSFSYQGELSWWDKKLESDMKITHNETVAIDFFLYYLVKQGDKHFKENIERACQIKKEE